MNEMVQMELYNYDNLQRRIYELEQELKMKDEEMKTKLKKAFQLDNSYSYISLYIDAEEIVKELYSEELEIAGRKYTINKERDFECIIYSLWKEVEEEE